MVVAPPGPGILRNQGFGIGFRRSRERVPGLGKSGPGAARARNPPKSMVWDRFSTESGEGGGIGEIWPWRRQGQESSEIKGLG